MASAHFSESITLGVPPAYAFDFLADPSTAAIMSLQNMGSAAAGIVNALLTDLQAEPTAEVAEMLALIRDTRYWTQLPWTCEAVANFFARRGDLETAAVVAGALPRHGPFGSFGARQRTETLELVAALPNIDNLMATGAAMSPTDALDFAIERIEQLIHKQD